MKAAIHERYGLPNVLETKEVNKPIPKDNEILVKVYAATLNRTDCAIISGKPDIIRLSEGLIKPANKFSGTDFAGEIEAVGSSVNTYKVGDRIFGFDDKGLKSHAQYITISENKPISVIPSDISYEQAVASLEGAHYANNFINKVDLHDGDKVLVNGATGAIGSAVVQLSKYFGATITAVCRGEDFDLVMSLGASKVIDYLKDDFTTTYERYNYVFDAVGKSSFLKCKPLLQTGGTYISSELGWMAQNVFFALLKPVIGNKKVIFPFPSNIDATIKLISKLIEQGKFKAVIDREYPLGEIADAYEYALSGQKKGNVIIKM